MNYCCYAKCAYCKNHMPIDYCRDKKKTGFFDSSPACENFELNNKVKHYMTHTKTKSESDDCSKEHNTTEEAKENELFELRIKNESLHAELKQKENELCELYQQNKKKDELINKNAS